MGLADRLAAAKAEKSKTKCLGCQIEALLSEDDRATLRSAYEARESVKSLTRLLNATLAEDYGLERGIGETSLGRHLSGGCKS